MLWTRLGRDSPRTARRLAACAVVACAAALASAAAAPAQDSPLHLTEVVDDTFTDSQCGFRVTVHTFADFRHSVFFDDGGNVDRVITSVSQAETTLSANGVVLRSAGAGATITEFKPESGAESTTTHGLTANFVVPGAGPVWLDAGRIFYLFAPRRPISSPACGSSTARRCARHSPADRSIPAAPNDGGPPRSPSRAGVPYTDATNRAWKATAPVALLLPHRCRSDGMADHAPVDACCSGCSTLGLRDASMRLDLRVVVRRTRYRAAPVAWLRASRKSNVT